MQSFKRFLARFIVLTFFLAWTLLLGSETWAVQQTCNPMIKPVQESDLKAFSNSCRPPCLSPKILVDDICVYPCPSGKTRLKGGCVDQCQSPKIFANGKCVDKNCRNAELLGLGGAALAAGGAAAFGLPGILVFGIGIAAWWIARTVVKAITCN